MRYHISLTTSRYVLYCYSIQADVKSIYLKIVFNILIIVISKYYVSIISISAQVINTAEREPKPEPTPESSPSKKKKKKGNKDSNISSQYSQNMIND